MQQPIIIPLGIQSYARPSGFEPEVVLRNMYLEKDESGAAPYEGDPIYRLQRPGLTPYATLSGNIRGAFQGQNIGTGEPYIAAGTTLYRVSGGAGVSLGTISNDTFRVPMAATKFGLGLASSGAFYYWNFGTTTLSTIALPAGEQIVDIEQIAAYFILPTTSGRFYWMQPGATTIAALDFATAEAGPDGLIGIKRLNDELFMFGTETTEVWQLTGDSSTVFSRSPGRVFDKGAMSRDSIQTFDNGIYWVGRDGIVYRVDSVPRRVSTFGIEERLRLRTGLPSALTFTSAGHSFYVLRIPGQGTWAFDPSTGVWSEFATLEATVWAPHISIPLLDQALCGDSDSGKLWLLDPNAATDDGLAIERIVTGSVGFTGRATRKDSFAMGIGCSADCTIRLRWHDARESFPITYETMSARAPSDVVTHYQMGASDQPSCTFEISCIDPVRVRFSTAILNAAWQGGT